MNLFDTFRYDDKRVLVVGGATGMGAAVARMTLDAGAEVVVMDRAEIDLDGITPIHLDLSDRDSIERAVDECGGTVDALFCCAGVADGPLLPKINFLGHRHLINRLLHKGMLPRGSAIGMISSFGGFGWENNIDVLEEYLAIDDMEEAASWVTDYGRPDYMFNKQAMNLYVCREALGLLKRGIRINATMPGPTDTPLARANKEQWLDFGTDYREEVGGEPSTAVEQAGPIVFLCSDAAAGVTGALLVTDGGYIGSGLGRSFEPAKEAVDFLRSI